MQDTTSLLLILYSLLVLLWTIDDLPPYHLRQEFLKGTNRAQTAADINDVHGQGATSMRVCQLWFHCFQSGDKSVEDEPRSTFDESKLLQLVNENNRQTTRELAEALSISHFAVEHHLKQLRFTKKLGTWLPHDLSDAQKWQRMSIAHSLLSRYERNSFLPRLVTGDETWIMYVNFRRKRQWVGKGQTPSPDVKPDTHQKKIMLCVFWDIEAVVYWELLNAGTTLTAAIYSQQLEKVAVALRQNLKDNTSIPTTHSKLG